MKRLLVSILFLMSICAIGCTDAQNAERVLRVQGYTDIHITGYSWLGCGRDDAYSTGFEANAPNGQRVGGVVCQGLIGKGATIRIK